MDPEIFFPVTYARPRNATLRVAKAICATCPQQRLCLAEALALGEAFGIWGGLTPEERSRLVARGTPQTA